MSSVVTRAREVGRAMPTDLLDLQVEQVSEILTLFDCRPCFTRKHDPEPHPVHPVDR
jgi:hypothetical protein